MSELPLSGQTKHGVGAEPFPVGGGDMAARMRALPWNATALDPIDHWPLHLKVAVQICLDSAFPIMIFWGPDYALVYNDASIPVMGDKHPAGLGLRTCEVFSEVWDVVEPTFVHVTTSGQAVFAKEQLFFLWRDGYLEECYFDYTYSPVRGPNGRVDGVFSAGLETTDRALSERRGRLVGALSQAGIAALSVADLCARLGHVLATAPQDIAFALLYLVHDGGKQARLAMNVTLAGGTAASPLEASLSEPDGTPWPLVSVARSATAQRVDELSRLLPDLPGGAWPEPAAEAMVLPVMAPGPRGAVAGVFVVGISPRRRFDEAYRHFLEEITAVIATSLVNASAHAIERERRAELEEARAKADAANTAKSDFLAQMSHELRTPLNGILGFAQILLRDKPATDRQARGLKIINESGQHLLTLIDDILDLARIEAGKLELRVTTVSLSVFLQVVCDIVRVKAEERSLLFTQEAAADLPATVIVDEKRLRQVLLNLLSNATKFTDSGRVQLRVMRLPGSSATTVRLRFEVQDDGIGMSEEQLARLFTPFEQVAEAGRREGGTGLGLAISRQLVRLMGGDIVVCSRPGVGSTFSFEIEVPAPSTAIRAHLDQELPIGYEGERRKILVVDDVPHNRTMLVDALAPLGFQMADAGDGLEALGLAAQFQPDLVLMDLMMPVMDGFEAMRRLRSAPATARLPIIATSASVTAETDARSRDAGASLFLAKPIDQAALFNAIETLLSLTWRRDKSASTGSRAWKSPQVPSNR